MTGDAGSIAALLRLGAAELNRAGIAEARREASSLLELALGRDRAFVFAHPEFEPAPGNAARYLDLIKRRAGREPFHYIKGTKEFYGLEFAVSPAVLIPRPETEMLVENALEFLAGTHEPIFCEVGVGSGCISIAVLVNAPDARAVGLEISEAAIGTAAENASRHRVEGRFDVRRSDGFSAVEAGERFDLIVSNPPYIPAGDIAGLQPEVRGHEPVTSLTDGHDGLSIIRRLVAESPRFLNPGGMLTFEFGIGQSEQIATMFPPERWRSVAIRNDLQDIPRAISAFLID